MNLINGDCLEELKKIPEKSVDIVICDLPYGTTSIVWDNKIDLNILWRELLRVAKNDRTPFFFFCALNFGVDIINSNRKMFQYEFIWNKGHTTNPLHARHRILRCHELILVFYKKAPIYNYLKYHKIINVKNVEFDIDKPANQIDIIGYKQSILGSSNKGTIRQYEPKLPISVFNIETVKSNRLHPTQKPVALLEMIIKYYSNENDLVLDVTMGSGSTGEAAKNLGRRFIGIEKDKTIYDKAVKRLL